MIVDTDEGYLIRPERDDVAEGWRGDVEFCEALHDFNRKREAANWKAFDEAFRKAIKRTRR